MFEKRSHERLFQVEKKAPQEEEEEKEEEEGPLGCREF